MRRDPLEIVEKIFKVLEEENCALSINSIAKLTGIHNITVRKYIRLIELVRKEPIVEVIKTKHSIILKINR